jgi:hypothetical protein
VLNGYVMRAPGNLEPLDQSGGHKIPFRDCCKEDDAFHILAEVKGNEFRYWVTVENIKIATEGEKAVLVEETRIDVGVQYFIEPFKDNRSLFPYGSVGLFEPDDGSQMKVEYMIISPLADK